MSRCPRDDYLPLKSGDSLLLVRLTVTRHLVLRFLAYGRQVGVRAPVQAILDIYRFGVLNGGEQSVGEFDRTLESDRLMQVVLNELNDPHIAVGVVILNQLDSSKSHYSSQRPAFDPALGGGLNPLRENRPERN
jgi:hypothetical protein